MRVLPVGQARTLSCRRRPELGRTIPCCICNTEWSSPLEGNRSAISGESGCGPPHLPRAGATATEFPTQLSQSAQTPVDRPEEQGTTKVHAQSVTQLVNAALIALGVNRQILSCQ